MEHLKISQLKVLKRDQFKRVGDLINIDGPILSVFKEEGDSNLYLFDWADSDNYVNRWLVYQVALDSLKKFITNKISYKQLFQASLNSEYYFIDIRNELSGSDWVLSQISIVPEDYIPLDENMFDKKDAKNFEQIIFTLSNPLKERRFVNQNVQSREPTFKKAFQRRYNFEVVSGKANEGHVPTGNPFGLNLRNRQNARENKRVSGFA